MDNRPTRKPATRKANTLETRKKYTTIYNGEEIANVQYLSELFNVIASFFMSIATTERNVTLIVREWDNPSTDTIVHCD